MPKKTTMVNLASIFEEMLGDINYEGDKFSMELYPFKVRVGMPYRRPPRHEMWEFFLEMGRLDIDRVFKKEPFQTDSLTFVFPERWMNVSEQRNFMHQLKQHPDVKTLKQVDMITHSPLMLGEFTRHMIRILKWEDDLLYEYEKSVKFSLSE